MEQKISVGVLGATSPVGNQVLDQLVKRGVSVVAFSRKQVQSSDDSVRWVSLSDVDASTLQAEVGAITLWIAASPIWVVSDYFQLFVQLGAQKLVCVSSTSQFTKTTSSSPHEEQVVNKLIDGERSLQAWSENQGIQWIVLRPTLIYGRSNDRNLSEIVKIIKKLKFFPLFGKAQGLRQPIYVDDVASACVQALFSTKAADKAYNISGAEQLSYQEMVARVFIAMGEKPRLLGINLTLFQFALFFLKKIPRYKNWNSDMVQRMNRDMVFDHEEARRDFDFDPQRFVLKERDIQ